MIFLRLKIGMRLTGEMPTGIREDDDLITPASEERQIRIAVSFSLPEEVSSGSDWSASVPACNYSSKRQHGNRDGCAPVFTRSLSRLVGILTSSLNLRLTLPPHGLTMLLR
ncbi:MAG TPA: hypothetical protein DC054_07150 [Blastocatellia bacterium]|nr:hypothetical protein [Blastocatellia bacterium]